MTYIGCINGAGCVYAEVLSNTALGAPWSGGNADGFAQNYLRSCDIGSHDEAGVFYLSSRMGGLESPRQSSGPLVEVEGSDSWLRPSTAASWMPALTATMPRSTIMGAIHGEKSAKRNGALMRLSALRAAALHRQLRCVFWLVSPPQRPDTVCLGVLCTSTAHENFLGASGLVFFQNLCRDVLANPSTCDRA